MARPKGHQSQLCDFSCKQFAAINKEMYENSSRQERLDIEGDPPTRDNFSLYKQALSKITNIKNNSMKIPTSILKFLLHVFVAINKEYMR